MASGLNLSGSKGCALQHYLEFHPLLLTQSLQFSPSYLASLILAPVSYFCDITFQLNKTKCCTYNNNCVSCIRVPPIRLSQGQTLTQLNSGPVNVIPSSLS